LHDLEFRQLVERIKLRSPIENVVGERVGELKKKGALFWARCPFHEERTPSFAVDPRKGTWRCYGACGDGGDVISFIERFDGLSFLDALRLLAQGLGEELPEALFRKRSRAANARLEDSYDVLRRAARLYRRSLNDAGGTAARTYARERGLSEEVLEAFGVGWAPRDGNPLLASAREAGVAIELLIETGLVRQSEDGRAYDFFRGRLMVPICDRLGRTVGFGGRLLPGDENPDRPQAKYVNTAETPLFHKGRLVFGLDRAAEAVRRSHHLVLVEGYTDVMAAHQMGHRNVAAVLGTSTTEDHAAIVRRSGARRVTLFFDGDEAGRRASVRALAGLLPLELDLDVAVLPAGCEGCDPGDLLLRSDGAALFAGGVERAVGWFDWSLDALRDLGSAELARGVDELFELIARLARPVERAARLRELCAALDLPEDEVRAQWRGFMERLRPSGAVRASRAVRRAASRELAAPDAPTSEEQAFELLLGALLLDNSLIPVYGDLARSAPQGDLRAFFGALLDLYEHGPDDQPIHAGSLLTELSDHPARERVVVIEELARNAENPQVLARDQERWLERRREESELAELRSRLNERTPTPEGDTADDLLRSLHRKLRERGVPRAPAHP